MYFSFPTAEGNISLPITLRQFFAFSNHRARSGRLWHSIYLEEKNICHHVASETSYFNMRTAGRRKQRRQMGHYVSQRGGENDFAPEWR